MNLAYTRLHDAAKHADAISAGSPWLLATLEVNEYGIRTKIVYRKDDQRWVMHHQVAWDTLDNAQGNPLIDALNECHRAVLVEVGA